MLTQAYADGRSRDGKDVVVGKDMVPHVIDDNIHRLDLRRN